MIKIIAVAIFLLSLVGCADEPPDRPGVKLYAMHCGSLDVSDMGDFSDEGTFDGESISMVNPSFLIRHPKGDLLWDTGYEDTLAESPDGSVFGVWHSRLKTKLVDQLAQLGLAPADIEYLSLSHIHPDHSGNGNLFAGSTFIVNELERRYMFSEEIKAMFAASYSRLEDAETVLFKDEYDVFGDGTAVIKSMPGHTPGSSVLLVRTEDSGNFLLTGDLYTHARGRELQTVPTFTVDKQKLLDSRRAFEALAGKENARVVIQHSAADFEALPTFPAYAD